MGTAFTQGRGKCGSDRPRDEARAVFRNAILDAAEAVFAERGFHAARIQDIAKRAQIAVGTIYNHFCQKEDLLLALLEERTHGMLSELMAHPEDPPAFRARFEAQITRLLAFIDRHKGFFSVAMEAGLTEPHRPSTAKGIGSHLVLETQAAFLKLVQDGIEEGALARIDPARLSRFLAGTIRGIASQASAGGGSLASEAPMIVSLFLHGAADRRASTFEVKEPGPAKVAS
jgi:AcrR family transcriptional regulator